MRQESKEPFSDFLPQFEKILADIGKISQLDIVKCLYLDNTFTFELYYLAITMPIATTYSNYISKLLYINNLYYIMIKHTSREYTSKESLASNYKDKDLIN